MPPSFVTATSTASMLGSVPRPNASITGAPWPGAARDQRQRQRAHTPCRRESSPTRARPAVPANRNEADTRGVRRARSDRQIPRPSGSSRLSHAARPKSDAPIASSISEPTHQQCQSATAAHPPRRALHPKAHQCTRQRVTGDAACVIARRQSCRRHLRRSMYLQRPDEAAAHAGAVQPAQQCERERGKRLGGQ